MLKLIAAGTTALMLIAAPFACAEETNKPRTMTISATGTASAAPDIARINMGVQTQAKTANAALADNNKRMSALLTALKQTGLAEKDIQTSQFSVSPQYANRRSSSGSYDEPPLVIGYQVSNQVHVIIRDLDKLGVVLDKVVADGANRMNGISFSFDDPQPLMDEARRKAVAEANRKAALYAQAAGIALGRILTFNEQGGGQPRPMMAMARMESMSAVPIAVGESEISASVSITYEIH